MSYTPPSGNVADLNFTSGYLIPAGDAANLSFAQSGAVGFLATKFGTPATLLAQSGFAATQFGVPSVALRGVGFTATQFGTPKRYGYEFATALSPQTQFGNPVVKVIGVGWQATKFGTGQLHLTLPAFSAAPATAFGTPIKILYRASTIGQVTQWAWPWTGYVATPQTWEIAGFQTGRFGSPSLWVDPSKPAHQYCATTGSKVTSFGTPTCSLLTIASTSGFSATAHGTPFAKETQPATGWQTGAFGQPYTINVAKAFGFKSLALGAPTHTRAVFATAVQPKIRFGTPGIFRSNTYKAYRINTPTRFGRPRGYSRFNYRPQAIHTTSFGIPTSFENHRVSAMWPNTRLGKPMLKRTTLC